MDLALNNLQRLKCHKTQPTNQPLLFLVISIFHAGSKIIGHLYKSSFQRGGETCQRYTTLLSSLPRAG